MTPVFAVFAGSVVLAALGVGVFALLYPLFAPRRAVLPGQRYHVRGIGPVEVLDVADNLRVGSWVEYQADDWGFTCKAPPEAFKANATLIPYTERP